MTPLLPRIIRLRDAPHYLGMDPNRFNAEVRPDLTEIPIGSHGVGFDRLDLDAWVDDYKATHGKPGRNEKGAKATCQKTRQGLGKGTVSGTFGSGSAAAKYERVRAQAISERQKKC